MVRNREVNYLDVMRICACIAVVGIHVTSNLGGFNQLDLSFWYIYSIAAACRWSVPVFVMISGALLLNPAKNEPLVIFFKKRLGRVVLPLIFWSCVYYVWAYNWEKTQVDLKYIIKTFIEGRPSNHLYFLFLICGLYLFTPALRIYIREASATDRKYFVAISLGLAVLYSLFQYYIFKEKFIYSMNSITMFIPFIGYYVLGYNLTVAAKARPLKYCMIFFANILLIVLGSFVYVKIFNDDRYISYLICYVSPTVMAMSYSIFMIIRILGNNFVQSKRPWFQNYMYQASSATLGVYLMHPIILALVQKYFDPSLFLPIPWLNIPAMIMLTTFICFAIIMSARKLSFAKYILG